MMAAIIFLNVIGNEQAGYMMIRAAEERPELVKAIVGVEPSVLGDIEPAHKIKVST